MTLEHKILHLIDRGICSVIDVCSLLDRKKWDLAKLRNFGLIEWTVKPYMQLTAKGVERLKELDGQS